MESCHTFGKLTQVPRTSRRYRLHDPAKRIVIERAAKTLDFERLRSAAG